MPNETTIPLKHPILAYGETVTELKLQRMKLKHLKAVKSSASDVENLLVLLEQLSGLPAPDLEQIDAEDLAVIGEALGKQAASSQPTTGT